MQNVQSQTASPFPAVSRFVEKALSLIEISRGKLKTFVNIWNELEPAKGR